MSSQEKKRYLQRYCKLDKSINQKLEELAKVKALCEKVTATLSFAPGGGNGTKEDSYIKLIVLRDEINAETDNYVNMRLEIEAKINTVPDETLRTLLRYRYINGNTFEQVAVNMNYCYMQVCRLHGKALSEMQ